jgi:4-hydroxybenzoate polyprenyltransferase
MLGDLLRLARAPLAATAIADGLAGYLLATVRSATPGIAVVDASAFARFKNVAAPAPLYPENALPVEAIHDWRPLAGALVASAALYCSGMVLNDWFDLERDRKLYPFRPLPSGRVAPSVALILGLVLMSAGVLAGFLAGGERGALVALGTAACVLAYDGLLKRSRMPGCFAMGACRAGNILLGGTIALSHSIDAEGSLRLHWPYAVAIGIYVFSLTLLSTFEDEDERGAGLGLGLFGVFAVPVALLLSLPQASRGAAFLAAHLVLVFVLALGAVQKGTKATGHTTTRWLLRGLLLLDAGAIAGSGLPLLWSAAVVVLIVPNAVGARLLFSRGRPTETPPTAS